METLHVTIFPQEMDFSPMASLNEEVVIFISLLTVKITIPYAFATEEVLQISILNFME